MLNVFRENLRHLKWVLFLVVASFVLTIFAVWGGGVGRSGSSSGPGALWAAKVDGDVISIQAFQQEARNLDSTYQQLLGAQYSQQRQFIRVGRQAINSLVERELLQREAARVGLKVSNEEVAEAIMREPAFQQDGVFIGKERYEQLFKSNQSGLEGFEELVRRNLLLDKLRALLQDSVTVSEAEVRDTYARQNEKLTIDYLLFENDSLKVPAPSPEELHTYYQTHQDDYPSGEGRAGRIVFFDFADIAGGIEVPEAEIHARYAQNLGTVYTSPERRRASHILFKLPPNPTPEEVEAAQAKASKALERVRGGEDFAEVAQEVSEDTTAQAGGDLNYFTKEEMVPEFSAATWALEVGQISDLVRSPFGFHIIRLTDAQPRREKTLEEVRPQILSQLKDERARAEANRRALDFVSRIRNAGVSFEDAATTIGVAPKSFESLYRGDPFPDLGDQPSLMSRLFSLEKNAVSDPIPLSGGQAVVQFLATTESLPLPFEKVEDRLKQDFESTAREELVRGKIEAAGGTANLEATAKKLNKELVSADPVSRTDVIAGLGGGAELMRDLFALEAGEIEGPRALPSGVAVIRVLAHSDPLEGFEAGSAATRTNLLATKRDRFFRAYLDKLRGKSEIFINQDLVDRVDQT